MRVQRRPLHGVLLLNKPEGLSSNEALQKVKWLLRAEKAGHTGTLDPLASGVLPLCFGAATKFSHLQLQASKSYVACVKLGVKTSTGDREGEVIARKDVPATSVAGWMTQLEAMLQAACAKLRGAITQVPPMTSALKREGQPLYVLARQGLEVPRAARPVFIHDLRFELTGCDTLSLHVTCSKGTYIRTLAEDLGDLLGYGAHLTGLLRTASGDFSIAQCHTLEALQTMSEAQREAALLPVDVLLSAFTRVDLDSQEAGRFLTGARRAVALPDCEGVRVYGPNQALLGLAHIKAGALIANRLLSPTEVASLAAASAQRPTGLVSATMRPLGA